MYSRVNGDTRKRHGRQHASGHPAFADIDHHHPEREGITLRSQRIRCACVAAALGANIDAAFELSNDQAADQRAEQICDECFESEFEHRARIVRDAAGIWAMSSRGDRDAEAQNMGVYAALELLFLGKWISAIMQRTLPPPRR